MGEVDIVKVNRKEADGCFFSEHEYKIRKGFRMYCKLNKKRDCRFGLTDITVPRDCPLRKSAILIKIELNS